MLSNEFLNRMSEMLGNEYESFQSGIESAPRKALRLNPLKKNKGGLPTTEDPALLPCIFGSSPVVRVPWNPCGYYYDEDLAPGKSPLHDAGLYYIQEPSAMSPVILLNPQPGERILDLCAAPGGKSTQIAGFMNGEGLLICNEYNAGRARILSENIERIGVTNALVTNESSDSLASRFPGFFDRILVDAPCSGEGMFRKSDEAVTEWSVDNTLLCADRQDEILDNAAAMLRAGGTLVYSTCTFAPVENEGSITRFLTRHPEFTILPADAVKTCLPGSDSSSYLMRGDGVASWYPETPAAISDTLHIWPQYHGGEGHFAALLRKAGDPQDAAVCMPTHGYQNALSSAVPPEYLSFLRETLSPEPAEKYADSSSLLLYGENLYYMPKDTPMLKGLKVLRPGLHLGTLKKGRFEPSFALALSLSPCEVRLSADLSDEEARAYRQGLTINRDGEKGWYLICTHGYSMSFGKLAGGVIKNHYPKGLRR